MTNATALLSPANAARLAQAEQAFRHRLAALGATLLEPRYLGARERHHVRCSAGHDCYPMPTNAQKGRGICKTCANLTPAGAEARFRARLAEYGAVLTGTYTGNRMPVAVRCAAGHQFLMSWTSLQNSTGPCRICAHHDPATAFADFRAALTAVGAELLEPEWRGARKRHHARCAAGHECWPYPTVAQRGGGICLTCAGMDTAVAEAAFRARLADLGAVLKSRWLGVDHKHHVICAAGHNCYPTPNKVQQGRGICPSCAVNWDAFYVVTSPLAVKFGITSGDPAGRLRVHARSGYRTIVRCATGLPDGVAHETERAVRSALALAREPPVRGREYFDISCLALILDVSDSWLGTQPSSGGVPGTVAMYLATSS